MGFFTAGEVGWSSACLLFTCIFMTHWGAMRGYKVRPYAGETVEKSSWNREQWWIICASIVSQWNNGARQACVNWPVSVSTFLLSVRLRADNWIGSSGSSLDPLLGSFWIQIDWFAFVVLLWVSSMQFWEALYSEKIHLIHLLFSKVANKRVHYIWQRCKCFTARALKVKLGKLYIQSI